MTIGLEKKMKKYDQIIARYFAIIIELFDLETAEYEILKKLFLNSLHMLEQLIDTKYENPQELIKQFDLMRAEQKKIALRHSAAIKEMLAPAIKKFMETSGADPSLRGLTKRIANLIGPMDEQRETFRQTKIRLNKILRDLQKTEELN